MSIQDKKVQKIKGGLIMIKRKYGRIKIAITVIIIVTFLIGLFTFFYNPQVNSQVTKEEDKKLVSGKELYTKYCMACHGEQGDGKGIYAKYIYPKPRDFTAGVFKLRSTPTGSVPTDEDLENTIKKGMLGTGMPSFAYLSDEKIKAIISYIKKFATKCTGKKCINFFEARKAQPIELPEKIEKTDELLAQGAKFYKEVQCGKCHGDSGKGDGHGVEELKDRWGYPVKPRDFTKGEYIGGNSEIDLLKRFLTGMDGSPMPSFIDSIKEMAGNDKEKEKQLLWGLVYYVKSLEEKNIKIATPPKDNTIVVTSVPENFTFDFNAKGWENAPVYEIPLNRLWQTNNNYKIAYIKILHNNSKIGFFIEWDDQTGDFSNFKVGEFPDMIALQFSFEEEPPFLGMGSKEHPTNIWLYRADREEKITGVNKIYPNLANDLLTTVPQEADIFYTSKTAGNLRMADILPSSVEDLNAKGAQTIATQSINEQNVKGMGRWKNNKWQVVLVRDLKTSYKWDIQFDKNKKIPFAIAIWNGSEKDRNGQKFISTWFYLIIK